MKKITFVFFLCTSLLCAQSILVNEDFDPRTDYTVEQLIEEVLFLTSAGNGDVIVEGFQGNTNTSPQQRSWGVFLNPGGDFPFGQGLILSSGFANDAEGPNNNSGTSGGGWSGDADIQAVLDNQYGTTIPTNDATYWEFTFVPIGCEISFNYVFASEEYEADFECFDSVRDGFAFLLKGPGLPDDSGTPFGGTNIAAIPGSDNVPVSTATIHADTFLCGDEQQGINYFPDLYISNSGTNNKNVIQYDGYTDILTARADVIPGQQYTLKLVVADRGDSVLDSAVFFQAGSFQTGTALPDDFITIDGNAVCEGDVITLNPNLNTTGDYIWSVFNNATGEFDVIPGATNPTLDVSQAGIYQVQVEITPGCVLIDDITVEFAGAPDFFPPSPLAFCDPDNDGFGEFVLTSRNDQITGGNDDLNVAYYLTQENAEEEENPITAMPFENTVAGGQTVFARVDASDSSCFEIFPLALDINDTPPVENPNNIEACDNDADGQLIWDLTQVESELYQNLDASNYAQAYYLSFANAEAQTDAIANPNSFENSTQTTAIFVRVEDANDPPGCSRIVEFDITVNALPVPVDPDNLAECDNSTGSAIFDLTQTEDQILTNDPASTVLWFASFSDEQNGTTINNPEAFENTANPQTVVARMTNANGCIALTTLTIVVDELPDVADNFPPYQECDDDNDGFTANFDLSSQSDIITNSDASLDVTYHLTEDQAETGDDPIDASNPFTNTQANNQTLFVRVANTVSGCFVVRPYELEVLEAPVVNPPAAGESYVLVNCDDNADGISTFDLTQNNAAILLNQTNVDLSFHSSLDDAQSGDNPISNAEAFENTSNPQTIYLRLVNQNNGCVNDFSDASISSFEIRIETEAPALTCPNDVTDVSNDAEEYNIPDYFETGIATATDNCDAPVSLVSQSPAPGSVVTPGTYEINILVADGAGNESSCTFTLTVQNALGVDELTTDLNAISLYPNPAYEKVQLTNTGNLTITKVTIFDIHGRKTREFKDRVEMMDLASLASATYVVVIQTSQGQVVKKLIKK